MKSQRKREFFYFLFLFFVVLIFSIGVSRPLYAVSTPGNGFLFTTQQLQQQEEPLQEILPGPSFLEKAANFLYVLYDYVRKAIVFLLEKTIFKENPKLADFYGDVASFLASLTAVYLLLLLVSSAKKIIGLLLLLGWALFIVAILVRG